MKLYDELYFEITLEGTKSELRKFAKFLTSGELDEFFEIDPDYIVYSDNFASTADDADTEIIFTNDDVGIEITSISPEEFLNVFCKAAHALEVRGHLYDLDDEEYTFHSAKGDAGYDNGTHTVFNDELDARAREEELDD